MTIRIGIVGTGVMGADHARALVQHGTGGRLAALADNDTARAETLGAELGCDRIFANGHDLIADPEVDAVLVAAPDDTHVDLTLASMAAGKPVLCEKPLAPTADSAWEVVEAAVRTPRAHVQVGFMRRFDPWYVAMRRDLAAGAIGQPTMLHQAHRNVDVPNWFSDDMQVSNSAVHEFDVTRWLLSDEILNIRVIGSRAGGRAPTVGPLLIVMEMAGGVLVDLEVNLRAQYGYDILAELVGDCGSLALGRPAPVTTRHAGLQTAPFPPDWRGRFADAYRLQMNAWIASIKSGSRAGASCWDGYVAAAVAEAGLVAWNSGTRVSIDLRPRPHDM